MTSATAKPDPSGVPDAMAPADRAPIRERGAHRGSRGSAHPPHEGAGTLRIAQRSGRARRDRAQTTRRAGRTSPWREGKPAGWPAPAV
jgi:hypothetical protein